MIAPIARKEFVEQWRDGRFRWSAAIVLALLLMAVLAGVYQQRQRVADQRAAQEAEHARWYGQKPKNPHSAAHYGLYAFKPRLAPAFLDPGVEPYTGIAVWIEAHKQNEMLFRPAGDATLAQRFGELTVVLVFQVMLPLVAVLLTFSAFAGERERGTLRQLLSVGVRPRDLVFGKLLGSAAALGVVLIPAVVLGGVALALAGDAPGGVRFLPLAGVHLAWVTMFLLLGLAVSARASTPRSALAVLLGLWALNCLVAPRVLSAWAAARSPLPDPVAFQARLKDELGDPHGAPNKLKDAVAELMRKEGVSRPEDLSINVRGLQLQLGEEHGYTLFDRHHGELFGQMEAQERWLNRVGIAFPLVTVQTLSMALAGTDLRHHRDFVTAAEQHRRLTQKLLNDEIMARPLKPGEVYLAGPELWRQVPEFRYDAPSLGQLLRRHAGSLATLAGWLLVALVLALSGARQLQPL